MEKTRIKTFSSMSLDGYIVPADCDSVPRPECSSNGPEDFGLREFRDSVGCVVINGIYYATLQGADVWPFGDKMCYIIAPRSFTPAPGLRAEVIVTPDYIEAVAVLQGKAAGDIWLAGDHDFVSLFMHRGLIKEITLNILPLTLGQGLPMFGSYKQAKYWELLSHDCSDNGVIRARYTAR